MRGANPKISVVVPIYNSEKYIEKCIQSILVQSYDDFELLLINDGSKDGSGLICDNYAKVDTRIRVFHNSNKGVSAARNFGLDVSKGEWVTFVDSDDWIEVDYLKQLIQGNEECDLVVSYFYATGWSEWKSDPWKSGLYVDEGIKCCFNDNMREFSFMCSKMYKNSILKQYNVRFDLNISYAEDSIFTFNYLQYTNTIRVQNDALYCYNCFPSQSLTTKRWAWEAASYTIDTMYNTLSILELRYKWDGRAIKNFYTWAFLKRYLSGVVSHNTILQTRFILTEVCKNNTVSELFKVNVIVKNRFRTLFNFFICNNLYLLGAIMLHIENSISHKQ